jgi:hypothetical protein
LTLWQGGVALGKVYATCLRNPSGIGEGVQSVMIVTITTMFSNLRNWL